ncbi:MAG: transglutaminase TgpA family protein [Panacagrimonas sp.]
MNDYLPHRSLLHLLAVLSLVIAPHLLRVPLWESAVVTTLIAWRALASSRQWQLPRQPIKLAMALASFTGVYLVYGRITGQNAGVALLVLMLALKLTEMRSRRDVMVVVFLMYFLLVTHFLYSQELWTILYLLVSSVAITAVLIDAHHPGPPLPIRQSLRMAGGMIAQALPLMLAFFILFPRIPGPLWGLPEDAGPARSGISDSMAPGDISSLVESNEVAFRVRFESAPPGADRLYWRGPVFSDFDGRTWSPGAALTAESRPANIEVMGDPVRYEITLEPMRSRWLFGLDMADPRSLPPRSGIHRNGALIAPAPVTERILVRAVSATRYRLDGRLSNIELARDTRLPADFNPRTQALAKAWRGEGLDDSQIIERTLAMFRKQRFVYTLEPPLLGRHTVDEFLFDTRRGFCEHFASAFVFLMRAAGIPARVVGGYQGAEINEIGGYWIVRQSDAHAWAEVWLAERGWVRIDPTAAVAPNRVARGLRNALTAAEGLPAYLANRGNLGWYVAVRWDWVNAKWNEWVLAYGPELQNEFLSRFGLADVSRMILALTATISLVLAMVGLATMRRAAPPRLTERAVVLWRKAGRRLRRLGLEPHAGEGPRDFAHRVMVSEPALAAPMACALDAYIRLRYADEINPSLERDFAEAVRRLRR